MTSRVKQRMTLSGVQIAAILGLENFLTSHGLIICCPRCTADGSPYVETDNTPDVREWKIDCACTERRIAATKVTQPMDADGDLIAQAEAILKPVSLALRCPKPKCLTTPLEVERRPPDTIVRCRCLKRTIHPPHRHHPQRVH